MTRDLAQNEPLFNRFAALNRTITSSLDFEEALALIAGSGLKCVGADACLVLLQDNVGGDLRICAARGIDPAVAERFVGPMEESILSEIRHYLGISGMQGIAASPIISHGTVHGILVVILNAPLNAEECLLLSALADQAGITLENAHRHGTLIAREAKLQDEVERSGKLAGELERLIHSVAHELRAPLEAMTAGGKQLSAEMDEPSLSEKSRQDLIGIASGADAVAALIQDLLTYTHLAGTELELELVDLEDAVMEAVTGFQTKIDSQGGLVRIGSLRFRVLAHQHTLLKILGVLLSNAARFVNPGQRPLVEVTAETIGDFVRVSVLDNGRGIAGESLNRIFEVFEGPNPSGEYPGRGIGLAIVRRGLERMGGRSGVESTVGKGSRFWIELRGA